MPDVQWEDKISGSLAPLSTLPPELCVPLPPRRMPLGNGLECLVQWRPGGSAGKWRLNLTKRSASPDDPSPDVQTFQANIDLSNQVISIDRTGEDVSFFTWIDERLADIAAETRSRQEQERPAVLARARVSSRTMSLKDFIPHIVILLALAAFVYMFAVVNIKI